MEVLAALTAAPIVLDVDGQRYEMSPLRIKELAQLKTMIRRYIKREAQETAVMMTEAGAPPEHVKELWREVENGLKHPLQDEWLQEPEPLLEMVLLSLRYKQPDITPEEVERLLSNEKVLEQFRGAAEELNATDVEAEADAKKE